MDNSNAAIAETNYQTVNACTKKFAFQQILTIFIFVVVSVLHNLFVTSALGKQDSPILWILLGMTYLCLLFIIKDYIFLIVTDPVDDILLGKKKNIPEQQKKECRQCNIITHVSSYHCYSCNRCVQYFDHHCRYLNNCIGGKNYYQFYRLLLTVTMYCILIISKGIWVFVLQHQSQSFQKDTLSKWGVLATIIFTFIVLLAVDSLLCFHIYLILYLKSTTIQYLRSKEESPVESSQEMNRRQG